MNATVERVGLVVAILLGIQACQPADRTTHTELTAIEQLGKAIFFDDISSPKTQSCASCHGPESGFTGPIPGDEHGGVVYEGAVLGRFGNRKPPSAAYATSAPHFHFDEEEGAFKGGNFWDGRATGAHLGNPAADQAMGPFLNPVEQNCPDKQSVLEQIAGASYAALWEQVYGEALDPSNAEKVESNYERVALAVAAYEGSVEVNSFSSKYDYFLRGEAELTPEELRGLSLFNSKGKCIECHPSGLQSDGTPPLFTDFGFDNLGVPKNPDNPFYGMDTVLLADGSPINPEGAAWIDKGLGGFLETRPEWAHLAAENMGKHRVPTLRNVDRRPSPEFIKVYMHNGVFNSLEQLVSFYNTRDVGDWAPPEIAENIDPDLAGDLKLTPDEEAAIVAFLRILSDGYQPGS